MKRWRNQAIIGTYWLLGTLAVAALVLAAILYTVPGHFVLSRLIAPLTGGTVNVRGLSGDLPDTLHADVVEIRDTRGVWLHIEDVSLDWSALAALDNRFTIRRVTATKLVLLRLPERKKKSEAATPRIDIGSLAVARIEIAKSILGREVVLTAQGSLHYLSRHQVGADLSVTEIGGGDLYRVGGAIDRDVAHGTIRVREGAGGILTKLVGLPGLGAIDLDAQAGGDRAANTITIALTAGALRASGRGILGLAYRRADIDFSATAPAMQPRPDVSWDSLVLDGTMHGTFDAPKLSGTLQIGNAEFAGVKIARLAAEISGSGGTVDLKGEATALRIEGSGLFAEAPVVIAAHADLGAAARPITFTMAHPMIAVDGRLDTEGDAVLSAVVTVPSLVPFAASQNADLRGSAAFKIGMTQSGHQTTLALDGHIRAEGSSVSARVLGGNATLMLRATLDGNDITRSSVALRGSGVDANASGSFRNGTLKYGFSLALRDLSRLASTLNGELALSGSAAGPLKAAVLQASGHADMASHGFRRQRIAISLQASGLPDPFSAQVIADGRLDDAPISITGGLTLATDGRTRRANLTAAWRSLNARADLTLPQAGPPTGRANFDIKHLSDLASLVGTAIDGSANASVDIKTSGTKSIAAIHARASGPRVAGAKAGSIVAAGTVNDPFAAPSLALAVEAGNVDAEGVSGDAKGRLDGPLDRLGVVLESDLRDTSGHPAHIEARALVDEGKRTLRLERFDGTWRGLTVALKQPAVIDFANGIAVDRLVVGAAGGNIELSGRLTPKLAAVMSARGISASAFQSFFPQVPADGTLSATAQLTGTLAAPQGTVTVQGRNLSARGVSAKAVAPANLDAHGLLHGKSVTLDAAFVAGSSAHLTLTGELPLAADGAMALHAVGTADLAMLNPILTANGRQVRGRLTLDTAIAGTFAEPRVTGGGNLSGGEVRDFARSVRIGAIDAAVQAQGNVIHITKLSARAGAGSITGSGTIDLAASGMPVAILIQAKNARPIVSDRMTAVLSGDLKLSGKLRDALALSGTIDVSRGEINIPDKFLPEVATLNVRRRGEAPPLPDTAGITMLDVTVSAPGQVFVRGRGIDAEVAGDIHLSGISGAPFVTGGFDMKRGTLAVAGQTLVFTAGKVGFDGTGVHNRLDPTLNFVAQTTSGGVTATLTVGGYVSAPKITLSSTPQLPQDEVLAHLLFRQSVKQLSPLQLAEIAQALVSLGGVGSGFNPLGAVRKILGLDRLAVGSSSGAANGDSQTMVEAGKYISRNIYVGGRQNLSGGTQVQVQVDLTRSLKAQATLNTGANATVTKGNAAEDNGNSVGLSYQFEY